MPSNIHNNHGVAQDVQMDILQWGRVNFQGEIAQENKALFDEEMLQFPSLRL